MKIQLLRNAILLRFASVVLLTTFGTAGVDAAPGDLDPTFGVGGRVFTDMTTTQFCLPYTTGMVVQSDGRVIVSGGMWNPNAGLCLGRGFIVRYLANGTLDGTFGVGGKVLFDHGGGAGVALQPDGKLIVSRYDRLVRLLPDGGPDPSFGQGAGASDMLFPYYHSGSAKIQSDGRILAAADLESSYAMRRVNAVGSIDASFGTNGIVSISGSTSWGPPELFITPDEKILLLGDRDGYGVIARYDANGAPDPMFGDSGRSSFGQGFYWDGLMQPDGKVVILLERWSGGMQLARYEADGSLDPSFGKAGFVEIAPLGVVPTHILLAQDGKIVATGDRSGGTNGITATRFFADGTPDTSFGNGGITNHPMNRGLNAYAMTGPSAVLPDGRLLIATHFSPFHDLAATIAVASLTTASDVSISGRATAPNGAGLRNVTVVVTDFAGNHRTAVTSSLGYFGFEDLPAGSYTVSAQSKRFRFSTQTISLTSNVSDMELVGLE